MGGKQAGCIGHPGKYMFPDILRTHMDIPRLRPSAVAEQQSGALFRQGFDRRAPAGIRGRDESRIFLPSITRQDRNRFGRVLAAAEFPP